MVGRRHRIFGVAVSTYIFFREGFFYPIELPNDTVALDCVPCNPGTLPVPKEKLQ